MNRLLAIAVVVSLALNFLYIGCSGGGGGSSGLPTAEADSPELLERVADLEQLVDSIDTRLDSNFGQLEALRSSVNSFKARVPNIEQAEVLSHIEMVELPTFERFDAAPIKTIRMTGVNLQIVNGLGSTNTRNGAGNLLVGYQERAEAGRTDTRTGSHNISVGIGHSYTSFGGLVVGYNNSIWGIYSSVTGGAENFAIGDHSAVSGGGAVIARGFASSVSGGFENKAEGDGSSVSGGSGRAALRSLNWTAGGLYQEE